MAAEIGLLLLIISLVISFLVATLGFIAPQFEKSHHLCASANQLIPSLVHLNAFALTMSILILGHAFWVNDFSLTYVANHSNTQLANIFKIAAVWGGHEGSMLFWIVVTALWGSFTCFRTPKMNHFAYYFNAVIASILFGFLLFLLFTSNPFERLLPEIPIEGRDLNPILQDIGLVFHPPLLFIGYVGLSICFSGAIATLLCHKSNIQEHCKRIQPWAIITWIALTGGNAFGSWWAYNELGWGGWWFWDPVENASFIPWIVCTALIHSLRLNQKTNQAYLSSLFLCIFGFFVCLLGTFLVRSGVVQSVHAFASDPTRGASILSLMLIYSTLGFTLLVAKIPVIASIKPTQGMTKSTLMVIGNCLLLITALTVLLGTCYPLLFETVTGRVISVGAPYFNSVFVPLLTLMSIAMGAAPFQPWLKENKRNSKVLLVLGAIVFLLAISVNLHLLEQIEFNFICGVFCIIWMTTCTGLLLLQRYLQTQKLTLNFVAMLLGHTSVLVAITAGTIVSYFEQDELLRMGPGQGKEVAGYNFIYQQTRHVDTRAFTAVEAVIAVEDLDGKLISYITPQRRTFKSNAVELSAAGIYHSFLSDMYISMGTQLSDDEYLIRISYKPFVNGLWLSAFMMMLAGGIACVVYHRQQKLVKTYNSQNSHPSLLVNKVKP